MSHKMASIDTVQQAKQGQKDGFKPPFQIHNQEGHNDCSLACVVQLCHDPAEAVASFTLAELPFDGNSVDLILTGYFFKGFDFRLVIFCLFRWST
jgi:hypothetical protein